MPLPAGLSTVTVNGTATRPGTGSTEIPLVGRITFTPDVPQIIDLNTGTLITGQVFVSPDAAGNYSATLLAPDSMGITPTGWTYKVEMDFTEVEPSKFHISLTKNTTPVNMGALVPIGPTTGNVVGPSTVEGDLHVTGNFTVGSVAPGVIDPIPHAATHGSGGTDPVTVAQSQVTGLSDALAALGSPPSPASTVTGSTTFGQSSAAGSAATYSRGDHVHGTPAIPRLDQVSAPTAAVSLNSQKITSLANGSAASDAAAFGQIPTAGTSGTNYAAGNDSRIIGALQSASNLSDVGNKVTSLQNLGITGKSTATNETNATTSQQASTSLVVPVVANAVYLMMTKLAVQTPTGVNFVHGFTGPSGATMIWGDSSTFLNSIGSTDSWSGTGATKWANIFGTLTVGANAGNLTVTFASGTAANTATLATGSQIILFRIS